MMKASVRGQSCKWVVVVVYRILPVRRRARPLSLRAPDAKNSVLRVLLESIQRRWWMMIEDLRGGVHRRRRFWCLIFLSFSSWAGGVCLSSLSPVFCFEHEIDEWPPQAPKKSSFRGKLKFWQARYAILVILMVLCLTPPPKIPFEFLVRRSQKFESLRAN